MPVLLTALLDVRSPLHYTSGQPQRAWFATRSDCSDAQAGRRLLQAHALCPMSEPLDEEVEDDNAA